jgi:hypothetical protein
VPCREHVRPSAGYVDRSDRDAVAEHRHG